MHCNLCPHFTLVENMLEHVRLFHPHVDVSAEEAGKVECWPDGGPVIYEEDY
jgi:hypothetical protein